MNKQDQTEQRLYNDVLYLTSVEPARNYENTEILDEVSEYIMSEFMKLECRREYQEFEVEDKPYRNVIASFGPEEGERLIIGAHYDVAGDQAGADDNASGVAGLLELGRMIDKNQEDLKLRTDLVAYPLEEPPFFGTDKMGSAIHAKSIKENNVRVKAMLCLEMIGYYSEQPGSQSFPNESLKSQYPNTGNFIIVVGKTGQENLTSQVSSLMQRNCSVDVQKINLPGSEALARLSDHRNYWSHGYEAVMINDTSFLRNPHYHEKTDTIETLDFDKMAEVVKGVYGVVAGMQRGQGLRN